jgi:hypothetical protein
MTENLHGCKARPGLYKAFNPVNLKANPSKSSALAGAVCGDSQTAQMLLVRRPVGGPGLGRVLRPLGGVSRRSFQSIARWRNHCLDLSDFF